MKKHNWFVIFIGVAAWLHSSWSFATVIGGDSPFNIINGVSDALHWLYWFAPAAAAAAAIDVGMINLAEQFKSGEGSKARLITFGSLSVISYFGQVLFSLSHAGKYIASTGLSPASVFVASIVWEGLIWLLPAALPATLILWAWADTQSAEIVKEEVKEEAPLIITKPEVQQRLPIPADHAIGSGTNEVECPKCGWKKQYTNAKMAQRAYALHISTCTPVEVSVE